MNQWATDQASVLATPKPILVLDMYEHADHMGYGSNAGSWA